MSFFGRVMADAQRHVTEAPLVRAMPVPDAAAATAFGAPLDTAFDSPFSMEVDAFSEQPAMPAAASAAASDLERSHVATAAGYNRPLDDAGTRSSSAPLAKVAGATDRQAVRVPRGAAHVGVAQPPTVARGALPPPEEGAHAAAQIAAEGIEASERRSRSQLPEANLPALARDQRPASAEHGTAAANRASVGLSRVGMDEWIDGGARSPQASHSGIDTGPAVAASAVAADVSFASQQSRERADAASGGAPQDIRQALAQVDAQATRLQRMLAVDPPKSAPTEAMRSPPSAPVRSDASMQVTRSTPSVRIDHVDIVVTEPPSRPRPSVQERPGNPASRNYLRRL